MHLTPLRRPALFVTGTDTDVGKSVVAAAIARHLHLTSGLRVGVCKPVASGCADRNEDAERLRAAIDGRLPIDLVGPQSFKAAVSPKLAAAMEGRVIDVARIDAALDAIQTQSDVLIVEGAGGVFVPIDDETNVIDWIARLGVPTVVVARSGLGTINHTALMVEALRSRGIAVAGVVMNRWGGTPLEGDNRAEIERVARVRVLCAVPETKVASDATPGEVLAAIEGLNWRSLMSR